MSSGGGGGSRRRWRKKKSARCKDNCSNADEDLIQLNPQQHADSPTTSEAGSLTRNHSTDQSSRDSSSSKLSSYSKRRRKNRSREASLQTNFQTGQSSKQQNKQYERPTSKSSPSVRSCRTLQSRNADTPSTSGASDSSTQAGSSQADNQHSKKKVLEIPGFYYDEEKQRHFRILPGHSGGNVVTTETIRQKEAEKKRQSYLEERNSTKGSSEKVLPGNRVNSLVQLQENRMRGNCRSSYFKRMAHESAVKQMEIKPSSRVSPFPDHYFNGTSGYISNLELDSRQKQVLMVISDDYLSRLWQGEVVCERNPKTGQEEVTIANWSTVNILTTQLIWKVAHASWAQVREGENMYALYAISGGLSSTVQLMKCPTEGDGISQISYSYERSNESLWTCAWSNSPTLPAHLAIGSTGKAIVVDTLSTREQILYTSNSDVFAQAFSRKSPVLYNGTRLGEILGVDLRKPSSGHFDMTAVLSHRVAVCSLKLLKEENYVLASDMGGEIKLWDIRQCAVVQEFKGHHNENHHLPVKVDSTETILHAVGQDKYTRVWSLKSGDLLHTIPCPSARYKDNAPVAIYSQEFSCHAQPGFFLGQERQIHWYPMRTQETLITEIG
eukprot:XP_011668953.1 PREDICTED: DDB1- and CUL4-associated factor 4 [Strongylocentrotus purpuratus]